MRVLSFIILVVLLSGFVYKGNDFLVVDSKSFQVKGSTSIGDFTCEYESKTQDTLFLLSDTSFKYKIPVKEFGCGNFLLNRDFRKTLKEKEFPFVTISIGKLRKQGENYIYNLSVNLADKNKMFSNLVFETKGKQLKSDIILKFSDFNLVPPSKLGGAIKIREEIKLSLVLKTK